jgi:hypothetical protein
MFPLSHFSGISSINKISSSGEDEHSYQEILDNWEDVEIDDEESPTGVDNNGDKGTQKLNDQGNQQSPKSLQLNIDDKGPHIEESDVNLKGRLVSR